MGFLKKSLTICFLLAELALYCLILTGSGVGLRHSCFAAIVLCFLHCLLYSKGNSLMVGALACTVAADYFLVLSTPIRQLWGMVFFLIAQSLYAVKLHSANKKKGFLLARLLLIVVAESVTVIVLREKTDALALVSLCYYANLLMNIVLAFTLFKTNKLLAIGFLLFALCDTVIGLQVASGGYLPIAEDSLLHKILFSSFNLAWFFYLPSQVCLSLSCRKQNA